MKYRFKEGELKEINKRYKKNKKEQTIEWKNEIVMRKMYC